MQNTKNKTDEKTLNRIIAAAYKDAGLIERLKIYFLTKKDTEVKRIFNEYRTTAESVKNIPLDKYTRNGSELLNIQKKKIFVLRPVIAIPLLILLIAAAVLIIQNKNEEPVYTKVEIELAEEQVKTTLAIVNKVFKKTENLIQHEILPERVGKPIHKSLTIINEVLTGG